MNKRILIIGQHFWPESFRINDIADYLANDKGYSVDVLCGIPNYPSGKFTKNYGYFKNRTQKHNNINIRRVFEIPRGNNSNLRIFLNYITYPVASLFHLPRLLTKKYDSIFIYQLSPVMMALPGVLLGKLTHTETTMYVLDMWPENLYSVIDIKSPLLRKIALTTSNWYYKNVDKLIVLSETMRTALIEKTNISPDKIVVIPQVAEKLYETPIHDKDLHRRFRDKFVVLFTGNISPAQSFDTMIEAAEILKRKSYHDIHWLIVGDGMSKKDVIKIIKKRGLDETFTFEGFKPTTDIPKYTERADLLVGCLVKSDLLEATIPAKVFSYIAAAKPIVLSMDGEVQDLINNKINGGFAGQTEDASLLAKNIERIYKMSQVERNKFTVRLKSYHDKHLKRDDAFEMLTDFIENTSPKRL